MFSYLNKLLKRFMRYLLSIVIGVGLNYLTISKSCLIVIISEFLSEGII